MENLTIAQELIDKANAYAQSIIDKVTDTTISHQHLVQMHGMMFFAFIAGHKVGDSLVDKVVRSEKSMWLIETATDMETAMAAIGMAKVTGSVGATETYKEADPPFGNGKVKKYAKVSRIKLVEPS